MKETGNTAVLVAGIVAGRSLREVAAMAGVSLSTVQRRLKDPDVIADIKEERSQQRQETLGRFSQLRTASIDRLAVLVDDANAGISLRAIALILNATSRLDSTFDLEQRLTALESLFEEAALEVDDGDEAGEDVQAADDVGDDVQAVDDVG
jgi:AcrR family transcriptional regulator